MEAWVIMENRIGHSMRFSFLLSEGLWDRVPEFTLGCVLE